MQNHFKFFIVFMISVCSFLSCRDRNLETTRSLRKEIAIDLTSHQMFIAPHPDDWQLFMGEYAYDSIRSEKTKVTIIHTNSGDAGRSKEYWEARELASLASVRAVLNYPIVQGDASEISETVTIEGKSIQHYTLRNVSVYFLRLPDGFPNGAGTAAKDYASMLKLMKGDILTLTSVDGVNTYTWDELQSVIKGIVDRDLGATNQPVKFYIQDPGSEKKYSHSDHLVTQQLARNITHNYTSSTCRVLAFEDYRSKNKTEDLDKNISRKKSLLFSAYDVIMNGTMSECNVCMRSHYEWLLRSYHREYDC